MIRIGLEGGFEEYKTYQGIKMKSRKKRSFFILAELDCILINKYFEYQ
jgi:hypothetical protein